MVGKSENKKEAKNEAERQERKKEIVKKGIQNIDDLTLMLDLDKED